MNQAIQDVCDSPGERILLQLIVEVFQDRHLLVGPVLAVSVERTVVRCNALLGVGPHDCLVQKLFLFLGHIVRKEFDEQPNLAGLIGKTGHF